MVSVQVSDGKAGGSNPSGGAADTSCRNMYLASSEAEDGKAAKRDADYTTL